LAGGRDGETQSYRIQAPEEGQENRSQPGSKGRAAPKGSRPKDRAEP
jgi:hypothetical protein